MQGVLGMLRPQPEARSRGMWNTIHHTWGRLTIMAGMGNAILGALLIHDYKDESYLHWLLPACILVGGIGILALVLEAFKVQVCVCVCFELCGWVLYECVSHSMRHACITCLPTLTPASSRFFLSSGMSVDLLQPTSCVSVPCGIES